VIEKTHSPAIPTADYDDAQDFMFQWQTSSKQNFDGFANADYDQLGTRPLVGSKVILKRLITLRTRMRPVTRHSPSTAKQELEVE
jgi:hypothetical protein